MAGSLNKVLLMGNLTRDPELRYTPNGAPLAEFGLAMNRKWKDASNTMQEEVCFVDCTCWGKTAELAHQYLNKGRRVFVEGRLKLDQWTSQEGQKRSRLTVVVENLTFLDSRGEAAEGAQGAPPRRGNAPASRGGFHDAPPSHARNDDDAPPHEEDDVPF